MIVYAQNNIELEYHPAFCLVEVRWIGVLDNDLLIGLWHRVVELFPKYVIKRVLLDASHVEVNHLAAVFTSQVQQFYSQHLPLAAPLNVMKVARVSAGLPDYDQTIARFFANLHRQQQISFEFANFAHHYEAMDWLTDGSYSVQLE